MSNVLDTMLGGTFGLKVLILDFVLPKTLEPRGGLGTHTQLGDSGKGGRQADMSG